MPLVLGIMENEKIQIGPDITVWFGKPERGRPRLMIDAPKGIRITRIKRNIKYSK